MKQNLNNSPVEKLLTAFVDEPILSQLMLLTKYKHKVSNDKLSEIFLIHRSTAFRRYKKSFSRIKEELNDTIHTKKSV
jgi:hypothetical protein